MSDNTHIETITLDSLYSWSCKDPANWYPNSLTVTAPTSLIVPTASIADITTELNRAWALWHETAQNLIAGTQLGTDLIQGN